VRAAPCDGHSAGTPWPEPRRAIARASGYNAAMLHARALPRFAAILLLAAAASGQAATTAASAEPNVVFLHWNDFHGQFRPQRAAWKLRPGLPTDSAPLVGGAASLAGYVQRERDAAKARGRRVVVTDGGDWYQGTLEGNETKGELVVAFRNRLQPDAVVLGNHEYDFGPENVRRLCRLAGHPVLAANIVVDKARTRMPIDCVQPFARLDVHGVRVAVLGLITSDTKAVSTGPWGEDRFEDEFEALRVVLPAAEKAGDVVVLLTHCGLDVDRLLAKKFPQVPLILGGHSHTGLPEPVREGGTWIVQTHGKASGVARVEARADRAQKRLELLRGELVELDLARHPEDPDTRKWIDAQTKGLAATWDAPIGTIQIAAYDERSPRSSAAGNLVADAFRAHAKADLGFTNKGGLRARLVSGPLTRRMLYELLPFENNLVSFSLTGAQVRQALQSGLAKDRRPLELSGGSYRYEEGPDGRVLREVVIGGAPLDETRSYRVATSSFLARGGDGIGVFASGTDLVDHGVLLRDVLIQQAERDGGLVASDERRVQAIGERE
jgi:5'-nucleotidase/UDP-sugar diphosphatase